MWQSMLPLTSPATGTDGHIAGDGVRFHAKIEMQGMSPCAFQQEVWQGGCFLTKMWLPCEFWGKCWAIEGHPLLDMSYCCWSCRCLSRTNTTLLLIVITYDDKRDDRRNDADDNDMMIWWYNDDKRDDADDAAAADDDDNDDDADYDNDDD